MIEYYFKKQCPVDSEIRPPPSDFRVAWLMRLVEELNLSPTSLMYLLAVT